MTEKWSTLLTGILEEVYRLQAGLVSMRQECARLEEDGMWPAVPSFHWEPRRNSTHGEARYLRLEFPAGTPGLELESNRCRVYIGCKADKIAEARKKAANRRQWEELGAEIIRLERFLRMTRGSLERVASSVERYELPEGLPLLITRDLVTEGAPRGTSPVTKEEWILTGPPEVEYNLDAKVEVLGDDT